MVREGVTERANSRMVNFCAVVGCGNRADRNKDKSFYRLPAIITHQGEKTKEMSENRRRGWIAALRRQDIKPENYHHIRICSDHFISGKPADLYNSTSPDWIPSLSLGHNQAQQVDASRHIRTAERNAKRKKPQEGEFCAASKDTEGSNDNSQVTVSTTTEEGVVGNELVCNKLKKAKEELCALTVELAKAKKELAACNEEGFKNNDDKVCFYTGLPGWEAFLVLLKFLEPCLSTGGRKSLTAFQQVLMTLMRLRLNLLGQDLAYQFGVHESTISRTFMQVIEVLYVRLQPLILRPDRDVLRKTMPMMFRKHCPNCAVIIDCFEIFVERPSNLLARAQTYSCYKHHNTAKYLIGITPQGKVSFISEGWGGRVSDKHLTENSGLLNHFPGDVVLADRGFESVGMYCARISLPAFTRGKKQLGGIDVEQTRRIANVRSHVERAIGVLRQKYTILSGTQPVDFLIPRDDGIPILDKIVSVCCSLGNVCDSVVPFD